MEAKDRIDKIIAGNSSLVFIFSAIPIVLIFLLSRRFPFNPISTSFLYIHKVESALAFVFFLIGCLYKTVYMSEKMNFRRLKTEWSSAEIESLSGSGTSSAWGGTLSEDFSRYSAHEKKMLMLAAYYVPCTIIQFAFFLGVSGAGYLVASYRENTTYIFPFVVLTYIGFYLAYPKAANLSAMVEAIGSGPATRE